MTLRHSMLNRLLPGTLLLAVLALGQEPVTVDASSEQTALKSELTPGSGVREFGEQKTATGEPSNEKLPAVKPQTRDVTFCDLAKDPSSLDRATIRVTGFISHRFEEFLFWDPTCSETDTGFDLWISYADGGGTGEIYAPFRDERSVGMDSLHLVKDKTFEDFTALIRREFDTVVRVTLVGRLFVPSKTGDALNDTLAGFGHLGCCSLFVIEQVESFAPHNQPSLDYTASAGDYDGRPCGGVENSDLKDSKGGVFLGVQFDGGQAFIQEQEAADSGKRSWAFNDPKRVALEAIRSVHGVSLKSLKRIRSFPGRQVFEWNHGGDRTTVVVSRPYWLSFFSRSSEVAWVAVDVKTAVSCDKSLFFRFWSLFH